MNSKSLKIGLIGCGTVGTGVYQILTQNADLLEKRTRRKIEIVKIGVRDLKKVRATPIPQNLLTQDIDSIINNPEIDVIVELMGGIEPAYGYIQKAIGQGKSIVTANKALLAKHAKDIFKKAEEKKTLIGFEAAVAGGIPIIKALREGLIGNHIQELYGIINGTCNYILSEMEEKGTAFADVLKEAQRLGYAEQEPSFDVDGIDAAQKLSILMMLAFSVDPPQKFFVEGITAISALDIKYAHRMRFGIRLLAITRSNQGRLEARVHPVMIPENHPLADVRGVFNAIYLKGDAVGEAMFLGRGAGMMPTASAVVSDIAMIAQDTVWKPETDLAPAQLVPMEELVSEYYLRFSVLDQPGVLGKLSQFLGEEGVSIAQVFQEKVVPGGNVPVIILTHTAKESQMNQALQKLKKQSFMQGEPVLIRVLRLGASS